MTSLICKI